MVRYRKILLLCIGLCALSWGGCSVWAHHLEKKLHAKNHRQWVHHQSEIWTDPSVKKSVRRAPILFAHRGRVLGRGPDNHPESVARALAAGFLGVEIDLRFENGRLVVQHDKAAKAYALNEMLQKLAWKNHHPQPWTERDMSSGDVDERAQPWAERDPLNGGVDGSGPETLLWIDFKALSTRTADVAGPILKSALLRHHIKPNRILVESKDIEGLTRLRIILPGIKIILALGPMDHLRPWPPYLFLLYRLIFSDVHAVSMGHGRVNKGFVERIRPIPLYAFTVNDENEAQRLGGLGVLGIVTDRLEPHAKPGAY